MFVRLKNFSFLKSIFLKKNIFQLKSSPSNLKDWKLCHLFQEKTKFIFYDAEIKKQNKSRPLEPIIILDLTDQSLSISMKNSNEIQQNGIKGFQSLIEVLF